MSFNCELLWTKVSPQWLKFKRPLLMQAQVVMFHSWKMQSLHKDKIFHGVHPARSVLPLGQAFSLVSGRDMARTSVLYGAIIVLLNLTCWHAVLGLLELCNFRGHCLHISDKATKEVENHRILSHGLRLSQQKVQHQLVHVQPRWKTLTKQPLNTQMHNWPKFCSSFCWLQVWRRFSGSTKRNANKSQSFFKKKINLTSASTHPKGRTQIDAKTVRTSPGQDTGEW